LVTHIERGTQAEGFREYGPRRIFGPERDEVMGEWRRLHNKELYALYSSPKITGRTCGTYGGEEGCIHVFSGEA
jgi:hypothetical protein